MKWYILALKNSVLIKGRASRKEYWYFILFTFLIMVVVANLDDLLYQFAGAPKMGILSTAIFLVSLVPGFTVTVRRLHDVNKSGTWMLIYLIPFGGLYLLFLFISPSFYGNTRWGNKPASIEGDEEDAEVLDEFMLK
jgi:uncharacterized membrane protein YhaH (DUF805 family)